MLPPMPKPDPAGAGEGAGEVGLMGRTGINGSGRVGLSGGDVGADGTVARMAVLADGVA